MVVLWAVACFQLVLASRAEQLPTVDGSENPVREQVAPEMVEAWRSISNLDFSGAIVQFQALLEEEPDSRHARLGLALVTLNDPPKTNAKTQRVAEQLKSLIAEADDDLSIMAKYQLARLYHVHFFPARLEEARASYFALFEEHPQHFFGQHALMKLATLDLFAEWPVEDADGLIKRWEDRLSDFVDPVVRRNMLKKLGDAILWYDLPKSRALPLYLEANEIGFSRFDVRTLMMLKVYNISVSEGLPEITRVVATRYLEEFPSDLWSQYMREQLEALDAKEVGL